MSKPFNYGGQAVIEGVMMRGQKYMTIAVRKPDEEGMPDPEGEIVVHAEQLNPHIYNSRFMKIPFVRGLTLLWDALGLGMRSLMYSADVAMGDEEVSFEGPVAWGTIAFSLILAILIFFVTPLLLIGWFEGWLENYFAVAVATEVPYKVVNLIVNTVEGIIRIGIFIGYVWAIGQLADVQRVFSYHGAEHKTINAYENDLPLVPKKIATQSTVHPRCGTSFLLIVMVIALFIFVMLETPFQESPGIWFRISSRILFIPVIAGVAYEFLRISADHMDNPLMKMLISPGLALQKLTTREPDESMLEVAAAALTRLLREENMLPAEVPISSSESVAVAADT
ncbi:MAG: hypothetical protein B6242_04315 [Anaerolineaceae bacterium 4572_78]|nr:MAG: hypothetical protein B6242_04315 [Anaerolineaceae bacterium 4572_78]